ncbi:YybH family protein, partial [Gemmata sp.]|uniref:YybH family protein n=1 Tax=Gemmata sp. TaxID=1914242 RepID=UPI003F72AB8F
MSTHRLPRTVLLGALAAAAGWLAFGVGRPEAAGQIPAAPGGPAPAAADAKKDDRAADRAAVQKAIDAFEEAFKKGDAKAVAGLWAAEGEYVSDDGTTLTGRAALEKAYTEFFAKN